jgi:hypothetical protein
MNVGYHLSTITHSEADETRLRFECLKFYVSCDAIANRLEIRNVQ